MRKREITEPQIGGAHTGCVVSVLLVTPLVLYIAARTGGTFLILLSIIPIAIFLYIAYGFALSVLGLQSFAKRGKTGVLVYSESPNWQEYIENNWLPRIGNQFIILNWSKRKQWQNNISVRLFSYFVGAHKNFNPAIIILRKHRWPVIYRFYPAFRDAKHGDTFALIKLESALFEDIGKYAA